jgi:hypothetical protein
MIMIAVISAMVLSALTVSASSIRVLPVSREAATDCRVSK